jgi:two-component system, OmpR family, sensor histidine kinase KdpD
VLVNLLDNAIKYTRADSPIEIEVAHNGRELSIAVSDQGPGIAKGDEQRIFEKFYRCETSNVLPHPRGSGLGLAICKAIVETHGGHLVAENRPSGGARFTFTLPAAKSPPPTAETASELASDSSRAETTGRI